MSRPLVPRPRAAIAAIILGLAVLVGLGLLVQGDDSGLAVDDALNRWVHAHFGVLTRNDLVAFTDPGMVIGLLAMLLFGAVLVRRLDLAVLTVVAPLAATGITEWLLKPLFDRRNPVVLKITGAETLAYPSGHETAAAAMLVLVALVVLRASLSLPVKAAWLALVVLYYVITVLGLVGAYFHYATDTVGALGIAVAVVLGLALGVDRLRSAQRS